MTPLAPCPQPRYTTALSSSEVTRHESIAAKSRFVGGFSQVYQRSVMWQSLGKFVKSIQSIGSIRFCLSIAYPKGLQRSSIWFGLVSSL